MAKGGSTDLRMGNASYIPLVMLGLETWSQSSDLNLRSQVLISFLLVKVLYMV